MKDVIDKINENGFECFIVGGYVRDYLLGMSSYDIDICTNARIEELIKIFGDEGTYNKEYYSYHLERGKYHYDITTYRRELKYKKNKPIKLEVADTLKEDLLRRAFTINTFALDKDDNFIDLLDSKRDLNYGLIRVVGNTEKKFLEDKTRIIRAIRFSCTLDFELDDEIKLFLKNKAHYLNEVPLEYIKKELTKIFESNNYNKFFSLVKEYNLSKYLKIKFDRIIKPYDSYGIWAQIETDLPFTKDEKDIISSIKSLINYYNVVIDDIMLYRSEVINNVIRILNMDREYNSYKELKKLHSIIDIDIDLITIRKYVGINKSKEVFKEIESLILNNKLNNNRIDIINYLKGRKYE